jgi:transcriptional regulator GlxA family with amidase domain
MQNLPIFNVVGLVFDGCQASGVTSPFDAFNVINTLWKQQRGEEASLYNCKLVSKTGATIRCSNGIRLLTDNALTDDIKADLIIIPGIHHSNSKTLLDSLQRLQEECNWLKQKINDGCVIASNCSGVFLLAETGALKDKEATTAWWLGGLFKKLYPDINHCADQLLVKSGLLYSTGSMTANLGVMLKIAEQQVGRQLTQSAAKTMLIDASQSYASPYLFVQEHADHQDSLILAVESQLQRDISQRLTLDSLAQTHSVSVRTLSRRFKKANGVNLNDYLQSLRFVNTKLLLETTNLSIEQIAERIGYSSQSSLRRLFHKQLGISPKQYRQRVKQNAGA